MTVYMYICVCMLTVGITTNVGFFFYPSMKNQELLKISKEFKGILNFFCVFQPI